MTIIICIGDKKYSKPEDWPQYNDNLFLWAVELTMPDPDFLESIFHKYGLFNRATIESTKNNNISLDDDEDDPSDGEMDASLHDQLLQALRDIPQLSISIPEPVDYAKYREVCESAYLQSLNVTSCSEV
jgi:hypothetical protein